MDPDSRNNNNNNKQKASSSQRRGFAKPPSYRRGTLVTDKGKRETDPQAIELRSTETEKNDVIGSPLMTYLGNAAIPGEDGADVKESVSSSRPVSMNQSAMRTQAEIFSFVSKQKNKNAFFKELVRHIVFTGIFIAILFMQRDVFRSFLMNQALATAFITQQIDPSLQPFSTTFTDIQDWGNLNNWLISVLGGVLDTNTSYNGNPYPDESYSQYIESANILLGGVRLRQLRVKPEECHVDKTPIDCYPLYHSASTRDTSPFGPAYNTTKYLYQRSDQCESTYVFGNYLGYLEGPGYIVDLPLYSDFTARIEELLADGWYDSATRAVIITMNFLNVHLEGHVSVLYLILEFSPGGIIYPAYMMKTFRTNLYVSSLDYFRLVLELIFVLLLAYGLFGELKQIYEAVKKSGFRGYMRSLWNILEIINFVLFGITVGMYIYSINKASKFKFDLPRVEYFCDLEELAAAALTFYNINAANIIFTVFHTFKYLQLNRRLYILWKTLRHAGVDLLGFFFIFFVFTIGFLFMGWLTFGPDTVMFNTFSSSFATCWGFVMGNAPDYDTLASSNRLLGPAFFTLFSIFVFFILANMFIAIISDSFSEVHSNGLKKQVKITDEIEKTLLALVSKVRLLMSPKEQKPKRILDLLKSLENPDILSQENVTLDDMKSAIGKDATDADARELKNWYDKLHNRSKTVELKDHQSSDGSPKFSDDEDVGYEEPQPGSACLHSADIEQMQSSLSHLEEQMQQIQQNIQLLLQFHNHDN